MIQKTVNIEVKTSLKSIIMVRDSDICYSQGYYPSNNIALKMKTQGIFVKDFSRSEKSKIKDPKFVSLYNNITELAKKANKQKKIKY